MAASFRQLAGIPDSTASVSDSVLVIIDAQNEYAQGHLAVTDIETSRPAIASLVDKYRSNNGHIAHITHSVPEGTPVFTPGSELAKEFQELLPNGKNDENEFSVSKKFPGSFAETDLDSRLQKLGKKKLVLTGYMSHVCVSTTAREASQKGYDVIIARDAIGDRDIPGASGKEVTEMVIKELGDAFATIISSSDVKA